MEKILLVFLVSAAACTVAQRSPLGSNLLVAGRPTTVSKVTLQKVVGADWYDVATPPTATVIKGYAYTKGGWRVALILCYQAAIGTFWKVIDCFPVQGQYPHIQKIQQSRSDSLVVWMLLCKDLVVTQSYVLHNGTWTPR